jgi:hypothetical protein
MAEQEMLDINFTNGCSVAQLSDGLAGELFGDTGWIKEFSAYPSTAM